MLTERETEMLGLLQEVVNTTYIGSGTTLRGETFGTRKIPHELLTRIFEAVRKGLEELYSQSAPSLTPTSGPEEVVLSLQEIYVDLRAVERDVRYLRKALKRTLSTSEGYNDGR